VRSRKQEPETPVRRLNPLTQRVWVAALGRYGPPALVSPWNAYDGDYSDASLAHFCLSIRRNWLNKANDYLTPTPWRVLRKIARTRKYKNFGSTLRGSCAR
jgi:hypothetical protein